jgi:hypothetical protein
MTNFDSATQIICSNCGTPWERSDTRKMHYFRSASFTSYGSPATIVAAGEDMTYCPADTSGHLAKGSEALNSGKTAEDIRTDPDGLDSERASTGGADVVHDSTRQTRK